MSRGHQAGIPAGSPAQQIDALERRILCSRRASAARTAALRQSLLARLGSPLALLAAAGVGFALDRSRILRSRPVAAGGAGRPRAGVSLAMIMQTLGLAGALIDLLQASARPPAGS
jgi:hypothetical protein